MSAVRNLTRVNVPPTSRESVLEAHDEVLQQLFALNLRLSVVGRRAAVDHDLFTSVLGEVASTIDAVRDSLQELRHTEVPRQREHRALLSRAS